MCKHDCGDLGFCEACSCCSDTSVERSGTIKAAGQEGEVAEVMASMAAIQALHGRAKPWQVEHD